MKRIFVLLSVLLLLGANCLQAHEGEHAGAGIFGENPAYTHVLLNAMPVYGLSVSVLALVVALLARSKPARNLALVLIIVSAASAWPARQSGHAAYDEVRKVADAPGQEWLDKHMSRADKFVYLFYATAALAVAALIAQQKFPRAATPLTLLTLLLSLGSLGAGGWIGYAGGKIRHPEFRQPDLPASTNQHKSMERP